MAVSTLLSAVGHVLSDIFGVIVGDKISGRGVLLKTAAEAAKKVQEDNPRQALEKVLAYLDRLTVEILAKFMDESNPHVVYPRLFAKIGVDGRIGHEAKKILDERYKKLYRGKFHENDFATCLGHSIIQGEKGIDFEEAMKQFLYYAELDDSEFSVAMDQLKHDPLMGPTKVLWEKVVMEAKGQVKKIEDVLADQNLTAEIERLTSSMEASTAENKSKYDELKKEVETFQKGGWKSWLRI